MIKVIDSMSPSILPPGLLSGTSTELGDYDQCLSVVGQFDELKFVGKYCLATVNIPRRELFNPPILNRSQLSLPWIDGFIQQWYNNDNWYSIASSVCFPSVCHQEEIRRLLLSYHPILKSFEFNVTYCQSHDELRQYHPGIWIAL